VARRKDKTGRISVFKGREAKLNRAIFQILALKGPLTIYDIHKTVKTKSRLRHVRYASVNKRVRSLEESSFIKKTGVKKTKAGFKASTYELTARTYLAILLNSINLDELVMRVDEVAASVILGDIMRTST
jgi:chromosome segregation and condensation protein ScpB